MKKEEWKHVVSLVLGGVPDEAKRLGSGVCRSVRVLRGWGVVEGDRSRALSWRGLVARGLDKRWIELCGRFGWRRGRGLGRGAGAFEEWVSVRRSFEDECRRCWECW